ncbi:MAG: Na/Pi cotransporter family protein [Cyclobacteriaceae bacterium]|nr:Na/Pi cotransporter family protein [Cyclobacteriaceae bacterium]
MAWDIIVNALQIIGALGFFLFGMKVMSEGLQHVAGAKLRQILGAMTTNRYTGVLTGFVTTAILQSSSATTVMTVSFVNAGLITLTESAGVMMGANIGTTITGWLVSVIGFKFKISTIALPIIALGLPMILSSRENMKKWGETIIGFAILFLGLAALKDTVPDLRENEQVLAFLQQFEHPGFLTRLLFVLVGTLITIVMQSSSAAMTLTIALTAKGLPLDIAAAMVLGENIGTTITAELSSLVANVHAKRSARIHSIFNLIGVTWMVIIAPFFLELVTTVFPPPTEGGDANKFALAAFHTSFNLLNVILLLGFVKQLVAFATRTVKSKGEDDEEYRLEYISKGVFATAELSVEEAKKEIIQFGKITRKMTRLLGDLLHEEKEKKKDKLRKKIQKLEDFTDDMEEQIAKFLVKISESRLSEATSVEIQGMHTIINDLERIADITLRMSNDSKRINESNLQFTPQQLEGLDKMRGLTDKAISVMIESLYEIKKANIEKAYELEHAINATFKALKAVHMESIENIEYDVRAGIIFRDLYSAYEKIGDHIINVTDALIGHKEE